MQTLVQPRSSPSYDDDLVQWIEAQIHLLLENRFSELDIENLANIFPTHLPYSVEQILDDNFIP